MNNKPLASVLCSRGCHKTFFLLLMAFILPLSAFGEDGTIKGEVFIVTKGAENFRLGLVEILLFPEDVIQKHIDERKAHITDEMPDFDKDIKRSDESIAKTKDSIEKLKELNEQRRKLYLKSGKDYGVAERMEHRKPIERMEQALVLDESVRKRTLEVKKRWPTSRHFFKNLPETKNLTRTNSDGKFSLTVAKNGRFALVAHATRKTLESTEEYYWMVWASLEGKDSKEIILGNHNLMSSDSKESVVSTKSD